MAGRDVELDALTAGAEAADASGVDHAAELVTFAESAVATYASGEDDSATLAEARAAVAEGVGPAGLVDAAAVVGNFQRMVRIADGTGIPLDPPMKLFTEDIRLDLGIDRFGSAANTKPSGRLARRAGLALRGAVLAGMRLASRRRSRS